MRDKRWKIYALIPGGLISGFIIGLLPGNDNWLNCFTKSFTDLSEDFESGGGGGGGISGRLGLFKDERWEIPPPKGGEEILCFN